MRRKDIHLDFTSLLDITLVLLFFFIMAGSFDITAAKAQLAQEKTAVEQAEQAAMEKEAEYQEKIEMAVKLNEKNGQELRAIIEKYKNNKSLKFILNMEDGAHWKLTVKDGSTVIKVLDQNDDIDGAVCAIIEEARQGTSGVVLCDFIYNGDQFGSFAIHSRISDLLRSINNIYWSETDISTTEAVNE